MAQEHSNKESTKPKGWFSRRHTTPAEHTDARNTYKAEHGRIARQRKAAERERNAFVNPKVADVDGGEDATDDPYEDGTD